MATSDWLLGGIPGGLLSEGGDKGSGGFNLGEFIANNPWMQALWATLSIGEQRRIQGQYEQRTDQQTEDVLRLAQQRGPEALAIYDDSAQEALSWLEQRFQTLPGQYEQNRLGFLEDFDQRGSELIGGYGAGLQGFLSSLAERGADIQGGYRDRYRFAEEELEGYGEQQRADVNRYFDEERATTQQDLLSRGLLSSTEAASEFGGVTERRSAEQRRLSEDLTRNRIDILSALSGEGLLSQQLLSSEQGGYEFGGLNNLFVGQAGLNDARAVYDAAMRGDVVGARERLSGDIANFYGTNASNRSSIFGQYSGDFINWLQGINYIPPPPNQLPFTFGQNAVQPPNAPSTFSTLAPGLISAGGNLGGAAILASALSGRRLKTDIHDIDETAVLRSLKRLPISMWKYKSGGPEHVGPMADDFKTAFGLGSESAIPFIDAIGVLMASVKALAAEVDELRRIQATAQQAPAGQAPGYSPEARSPKPVAILAARKQVA